MSTWSGRIPAILWASLRPFGVRVLVSAPAGLEVADFAQVRAALAAACFAREVDVDRHNRHGNLIILFVSTTPPASRAVWGRKAHPW
jgi:hypothetical protein